MKVATMGPIRPELLIKGALPIIAPATESESGQKSVFALVFMVQIVNICVLYPVENLGDKPLGPIVQR